MGCKAITPHLVRLAKDLEDAPFHLVASHNQKGEKSDVLAYLRGHDLSPHSPNFTVTSFGRHPGVKGNGHVPYYMVFDHHGKLVREHMCGSYHGGDGLGMIDWVEKMLKAAPDVYLGAEPFEHVADLAAKVEQRKALGKTLAQVEARLAAGDDAAGELQRIVDGATRYRDGKLRRAEALYASQPGEVVSFLRKVEKELAGSSLAEGVKARADELAGSPSLEDSIALAKGLAKVRKSLAKLKACKPCKRRGTKTATHTCPTCRSEHGKSYAKLAKKLDALIEGHEDLPVAAAAAELAAALR